MPMPEYTDEYVYMVSYTFQTSQGGGSGRVFITRVEPITTPQHIEDIEALQNQRNGFTCAIMGFYLLSHTKPNPNEW